MPLSPLRTLGIPSEYAEYFDGIDDYVEVPSSPNLSGLNTITVEAWVYPTVIVGEAIFSKHDNYQNREWMLYISGIDYKYKFQVFDENTDTFSEVVGVVAVARKWTHIVGVYNNGILQIYCDGVLISSATTNKIIRVTNSPIRIGNRADNAAYYKGLIDEVRIYSRALSAGEILWNYNYPFNPIRNGLVLWLPGTDEAIQPPTWYDKSNFGNNGTIYGALKTQLIRKPVRTLTATRVLASAR